MILLEERTDQYRAFTYVLKQAKAVFFSLHNLLFPQVYVIQKRFF